MLKEFEKLEPLGNGVSIIVSDSYHFSTDTILLANFADVKSSDKIVELGTGCGTMPLLWSTDTPNRISLEHHLGVPIG